MSGGVCGRVSQVDKLVLICLLDAVTLACVAQEKAVADGWLSAALV